MRIIKELSKRIKEELHDAQWYAKAALEHKTENLQVAETYNRLAKEEMNHASMLHGNVVAIIRKVSAEKTPPPVMQELWAWQHEEIMEEEAEAKRLIDMYASHA